MKILNLTIQVHRRNETMAGLATNFGQSRIDHFEFLGEKVQVKINSKIELGISTNLS